MLVTRLCVVSALLTLCVFAQTKPDRKALLANFEKSIEGGRLAEVEKTLFEYVIANPKDAEGFSLLGALRLRQNRLQEAKSLSSKALALDNALVSAKLNLARVHFLLGEKELAAAVLDGIGEKDLPDIAIRFKVAEMASIVGNCAKAIALTDKLPLAIKNEKALPLRATCYLAAGDSKNLAALTMQAKSLVRRSPGVAVAFAEVLHKASMHRETAELLRALIAVAPRNADALLLLAKAEIALKDYSKASQRLTEIGKIRPKSADAALVRATLESEQGNNPAALELLEKSLAEKPDDVPMLSRYVIVALRSNQNAKALRAAERLLTLEPANLQFLYYQGIAALQSNSLPKAETALKKFLEARPTDSLGCLALGLTFAAQPERIAEARVQLEKCLAQNPGNYEASYQLGLSYKVQGETAKAIDYLEQTVKIAPDYAAALRDLGTVYLQSGGETKARPVLEKAATLDPKDAETRFQLSRLYNLIGETELARKELELFQKLKSPKKDGM